MSPAAAAQLFHSQSVSDAEVRCWCPPTAAVKSLHPNICIAVHCSIPLHPQLPWHMSQLITGDYVIKFERNSFRVQLSARGIAICFASAQRKSKSKSQIATTLAIF